MPESRLNFSDHDGSFSCMAVFMPPAIFGSSYDPKSKSHQTCRILKEFIDALHQEAPDDGMSILVEANRPALETEASIHLQDLGEDFSMHLTYRPAFDEKSPAHQACAKAVWALNHLNKAESDAIVTRSDGSIGIMAKEVINAKHGNG